MRTKFAIIFFIVSNLFAFGMLDFLFSFRDMPIFWFVGRVIILIICLIYFLYLSNELRKRVQKKWKNNLLALTIVFVSIFYVMEIFFTFYPKSNGDDTSYASKIWFYYYWRHNSSNFRDIEFKKQSENNQPDIYIIGDSFTAGHGIKYPKDRFSDILRQRFPKYDFYNLGFNGLNILQEYEILRQSPQKPEMVIWTYMYNDINYLKENLNLSEYHENKYLHANLNLKLHSFFLNFLSTHSHLLIEKVSGYITYLFVKKEFNLKIPYNKVKTMTNEDMIEVVTKSSGLPRDSVVTLMKDNRRDIDDELYQNEQTFDIQMSNMMVLKDYCDKNNISLLVLIYPRLDDKSLMSNCKDNCNKMEKYLVSNNIDCINLTPICASLSKKERVVNNLDPHPSVALNRLVADSLISTLSLKYSDLANN